MSWTMKYFHETLLLYCLNVIAHVSHQYKNCVHREKVSSDIENLIALILINNICCSKQNKKNQRDQNVSEWNHGWNTGTTKKHVLAYFQKFGWLTTSSIIFKWMLYHTIDHTIIFIYWLLFTFILLTLITIQYALITLTLLRYTFFILQITSSLLRN